jgi:hypothetical protein
MAKDSRPEGQAGDSSSQTSGPTTSGVSRDGAATAVDSVSFGSDGLSEADLADIESLLAQKQDITRNDIPAQDFQKMLARLGYRS